MTAKIKVIEKDDDGNDDFVTEMSAAVQDGKIRRKWKVVYTEDNDDTDSQKEMEEKGYTLPEYAFTVESSGVKSKESGQLDIMGWIKKQFIFNNSKNTVKNLNYEILFPDDSIIHNRIRHDGFIDLKDIKFKYYKIRLSTN